MNSQNVRTGNPAVDGAIFAAPASATLPADGVSPLDPAFKELGYASEAGISNSITTDVSSVNAWGGDEVLNEQTSRTEEFSFTLIETNSDTLTEVYGAENVTIDPNGSGLVVLHNARPLPERAHVYEIDMGGGVIKRIVVPRAKVNDVGDVIYNGSDPVGYELTVAAMPDEHGNTAYEYLAEIAGA